MANWQVISLDTTTPQLRAPGTGDGYSFNSGSTQLGVWTTTGLGIGTASPSQRLEVNGNIAVGGSLGTTPSLNRGIFVQSNTNNDVVGYGLYVNDGANNRRGSMFLDDATGLWGWDVTSSSGTPSYVWRVATAEVMRLDTSGNLGIGTSSPAYRLHVVGATTSISAFRRTTADDTQILVGNTAGDLQIRALANGNGLIFSDTGKTLGFGSNGSGTAQLTLDTSGNLGIGTASPSNTAGFSRQVQIEGTTAALTLSGTTGTGKYTLGVPGVNAIGLWDNTASAYRWYVDSSGNLGIGTTSPGARLDVVTGTARWRITNDGSGNIVQETLDSAGAVYRNLNSYALNHILYTSGSERARIDSSGRLLVGGTTAFGSANGSIEVNNLGSDQMFATRFNNAQGGVGFYLQKSRGTTVGTNTIVQNGDDLGFIMFRGANGTGYSDAAYLLASVDGTPGASADMPGRLTFWTSPDGSATPTERMRITNNGQVYIAPTTTTYPTVTTVAGTPGVINLANALIINSQFSVPSPYTQNIQIDIVWQAWGSNNVIGLVDLTVLSRQWAGTGGAAFGKVFATNTASATTFSTFNTTNVTTSQCTITAASGGNYTLRITIDPTGNTDVAGIYLVIPNGGATSNAVSSVTISLV